MPQEPSEEQTVVYDPLIELMARFENVKSTAGTGDAFAGLSIEDALRKHIVDGIKKNLDTRLAKALETYTPLAIINDILLDGMKTVGELFGAGKMQLPFVLQSAEVMKAAVRQLEPLMERVEGSDRGSILLATVAGDVHDIGKNLVDIILSNNGYRVVNIGIKQPINNILDQAQENSCQVIGLSGLLVKSTLIMRDNLLEMNARKVSHYPVILGGAALTRGYVEEDLRSIYEGNVYYAQDAFEGLRLMEQLSNSPALEGQAPLAAEAPAKDAAGPPGSALISNSLADAGAEDVAPPRVSSHRVGHVDPQLYVFTGDRSEIQPVAAPKLPFYGAKKFEKFDIHEIYKYINPIALFRGQWQYKRQAGMDNPAFDAWLREHVQPIFESKQRELSSVLKPKVKWGYFWAASEGNDLIVYEDDAITERLRFTFPRQRDGKRLCLADFFQPAKTSPSMSAHSDNLGGAGSRMHSGTRDVVGFSIVTVGPDITKLERSLFESGEYQDYLYAHGMGVETAEALAEYWHRQMRVELGIDDQEPSDMRLLFSAKYHGSRYSFGYPACPNLEDQGKLFELLRPEDIGIELTEEFMLSPEQSTSAIVVHHPEAKYFNVR